MTKEYNQAYLDEFITNSILLDGTPGVTLDQATQTIGSLEKDYKPQQLRDLRERTGITPDVHPDVLSEELTEFGMREILKAGLVSVDSDAGERLIPQGNGLIPFVRGQRITGDCLTHSAAISTLLGGKEAGIEIHTREIPVIEPSIHLNSNGRLDISKSTDRARLFRHSYAVNTLDRNRSIDPSRFYSDLIDITIGHTTDHAKIDERDMGVLGLVSPDYLQIVGRYIDHQSGNLDMSPQSIDETGAIYYPSIPVGTVDAQGEVANGLKPYAEYPVTDDSYDSVSFRIIKDDNGRYNAVVSIMRVGDESGYIPSLTMSVSSNGDVYGINGAYIFSQITLNRQGGKLAYLAGGWDSKETKSRDLRRLRKNCRKPRKVKIGNQELELGYDEDIFERAEEVTKEFRGILDALNSN